METSSTKSASFKDRLSARLNRFRRKSRHGPDSTSNRSSQTSRARSVNSSIVPSSQARETNTPLLANTDEATAQIDPNTILAGPSKHSNVDVTNHHRDLQTTISSLDLWSAAYREAIENLGNDIDVAILRGSSAAQLFRQLEEIDRNVSQESAFLRGVAFLRSIQIPLEKFKLALDLGSPLSSLEPTAATVFGVVRSVTAIAITFASADLDFAKQIGDMLSHLQYIDDCDTLGQRSNRQDIHKALVPIYQKILEFYQAAHAILTRRGAKLVIKLVLEASRLPRIVQDFLVLANVLQKLLGKAMLEVAEDIKDMLYDRDIERWLGGSKMSMQSKYHANLQELRTDEACVAPLEDPNFKKWYGASESRWLIMLGSMGYGKTTAMSFIIDELRQRNEHELPRPKICYHYCRSDETGQDCYILAVLILALLQQLHGLKKTFHVWYKDRQTSGIPDPAKSPRDLREFLENVLKTLDRPLFVVIDGVDECDRRSQKNLFKLLEALSHNTSRLKILLSSRPDGEVLRNLDGVSRIWLSSNQQRDVVIVRHMVEDQLPYLAENVKTLVIETLSRMAQGSGIWMRMTVKSIEIRGIHDFEPMRRFLKEIPSSDNVFALYDLMIARYSSNDPENIELLRTALKILAVACRPLSIQELAWAVALVTAHDKINTVADLALLVDHGRMTSLIHAFTACTDPNDLTKRQLNLVHESLKEFVVRNMSPQADATTSALKSFVLNICIDYLLLEEIGNVRLFSETQIAISELPQDTDLFEDMEPLEYDPQVSWEVWEENATRYDPVERGFGHFFVYAASQWLQYLKDVPNENLPELIKVEVLCQAGSIRLDNWINQYCRPDSAIKARFDFISELYDPLSIASLYGSDAVLCDMLENSKFDSSKFLPSSAIAAADQILQWGDLTRLKLLFLEDRLVHQLQNIDFFKLLIKRWSEIGVRHHNWGVAFDLVDLVLDVLVQERWGSELLCMAAHAGCVLMVKHLLNGIQYVPRLKTELLRNSQSIMVAVSENHADVVECLLEQEGFKALLDSIDSQGQNVLHLASDKCNPTILRLLAPHFRKRIHQIDDKGCSALVRIVTSRARSRDRYESASILLSSQSSLGVIAHSTDPQHDPLRLAVQLGDTQMCHTLIHDGMLDPSSALMRDKDGLLILKDEPHANGKAILQVLTSVRTSRTIDDTGNPIATT